jgi:hypothetical protein
MAPACLRHCVQDPLVDALHGQRNDHRVPSALSSSGAMDRLGDRASPTRAARAAWALPFTQTMARGGRRSSPVDRPSRRACARDVLARAAAQVRQRVDALRRGVRAREHAAGSRHRLPRQGAACLVCVARRARAAVRERRAWRGRAAASARVDAVLRSAAGCITAREGRGVARRVGGGIRRGRRLAGASVSRRDRAVLPAAAGVRLRAIGRRRPAPREHDRERVSSLHDDGAFATFRPGGGHAPFRERYDPLEGAPSARSDAPDVHVHTLAHSARALTPDAGPCASAPVTRQNDLTAYHAARPAAAAARRGDEAAARRRHPGRRAGLTTGYGRSRRATRQPAASAPVASFLARLAHVRQAPRAARSTACALTARAYLLRWSSNDGRHDQPTGSPHYDFIPGKRRDRTMSNGRT